MIAGCRCVSDSPAIDCRSLPLLLEFYDRGPHEFAFDLLANAAEPLLLGAAEAHGVPPERVRDILRVTDARRSHTAAADAVTWAAANDAVMTGGSIEHILPLWIGRARAAMPWRSSKAAKIKEIEAEIFAKYDGALQDLAAVSPSPPKLPLG